ncbi:hypothetical protein T4A_389 [Trichinella pseudospiralis]|uniref:Uncharacterized protein n=1 Tax=Trichinella pseudospiralis TaxID=6337 RepID=A0A0V1F276_TRIPS|nr:hypothetical protein T4A_389 [Trichinella pseudospiralis]
MGSIKCRLQYFKVQFDVLPFPKYIAPFGMITLKCMIRALKYKSQTKYYIRSVPQMFYYNSADKEN